MLKSSPLPILPIISFSCFLLFYCKVKAKAEVKAFLTSTCFSLLIGISHSIIDIEVACWCYKPVSLNPCFLLKGLVVIDYQLPNLVPHSYPHLIACLIVFKMDYPSVVSHLPALRLFLGMMFLFMVSSGFRVWSTHTWFAFGWVLTNKLPPPRVSTFLTTFHACCG